jgi:hypothetical protein
MPTFKIRAEEIVTYEFTVVADTIEEAVMAVEDGDEDDLRELGSSGFRVTEHTVPGQMGWNDWEGHSAPAFSWRREMKTQDLAVALRDMMNLNDESNLHVTAATGEQFRVSIVRVG